MSVEVAPKIVAPKKLLKLDLACGQNVREGYEGVDFVKTPQVKYVVNLLKFPFPWDNNSVEAIHCSHFIEHIPQCYVTPDNEYVLVPTSPEDKDLFFAFFDECYRILAPNGQMTVIAPSARSNRAWQDSTHRRAIVAETFLYLNADWRKMNKLDHYNVQCHFGINVNPTVPAELTLFSPEVQARRFNCEWNTTIDWVAQLVAIKDARR